MFKSAHSILVAASVALMMLGYVCQANAQRGGRDQTNELSLLGNQKIQEELELVDDQVEEIKELGDEVRTSMRAVFNDLRQNMNGASDQERRKMWGEMQEEMKTRYEELTPKIESVLLPAQVQRLAEIKMQATLRRSGGLTSERGSQVLKDQLDITDDQMEAMKEKAVEVRESLAAKMAKLRKQAEMEILSVLDTEQREKYKEMMGESYDVDSLFSRNGRGGNRGTRGGGGNRGRGGRRGGNNDNGNGDSDEAN